MFTEMLDSLKHHVITTLTRVKVRTQEEIAGHIYSVDPKTPGLVGYWKMDDPNSPNIVKDATGNGNDAKANKPLPWHNVSLPEK